MIRHLNIYCPKCSGPWSSRHLRVLHLARCDSRADMRPTPAQRCRAVRALIVDLVGQAAEESSGTIWLRGRPAHTAARTVVPIGGAL